MDRKERLIEVFNDTQQYLRENAVLAAAVDTSKAAAKLYGVEDYPELPEMKKAGTVTGKR